MWDCHSVKQNETKRKKEKETDSMVLGKWWSIAIGIQISVKKFF